MWHDERCGAWQTKNPVADRSSVCGVVSHKTELPILLALFGGGRQIFRLDPDTSALQLPQQPFDLFCTQATLLGFAALGFL